MSLSSLFLFVSGLVWSSGQKSYDDAARVMWGYLFSFRTLVAVSQEVVFLALFLFSLSMEFDGDD